MPNPTIPLNPIQNHCAVFASGTMVPRKIMCVAARRAIAIIVRYALTLSQPILLPADVKKIELTVQRNDVATAALSPITPGSKPLTILRRLFSSYVLGFHLPRLWPTFHQPELDMEQTNP
jgi:hypothetical protein